MLAVAQTRQVLSDIARAMSVCAEQPAHKNAIERFRTQIPAADEKPFDPSPLEPVSLALAVDTRLARQLTSFAGQLPWRETQRMPGQGNKAVLCSLDELFVFEDLTSGLLWLEPGVAYPERNHPPPELYFTLSGTAEWKFGGSDQYQSVSAGNLLHNHSLDTHGVQAGDTPLLALFLLWHFEP